MMIRRLGLRWWDVALVLAGVAALIVEGEARAKGGLSPGAFVLAVATAAPLAWRTRAPLAALAGVEAGAVLCVLAFDASAAATGLVLVELFTVALVGGRQQSLVVGSLTAIGVILAIVVVDGTLDLGAVAIRVPLVFVSIAFGDGTRSRLALRAAARERTEREEHEREEEGRRRAVQERLRIARELHDTLAHSLVAINVRAGVAVDLGDAEDQSGALREIKQVSATALRDLRATLSLVRDHDHAAPTAPAFDLEALPGLVERARSAGLHAEADVQVNGRRVECARRRPDVA